jgi:hypothetical protein
LLRLAQEVALETSQPDGTGPLPETAELGGEGGSFGDGASRESRRTDGRGSRVGEPVTDLAGYGTRLPEVKPEGDPTDE